MNRPSACCTILPRPRLVGPEEMVAAMEEEGVEAAVVLGFPWRREALWRRHNEVILEAQRRWPRKLFGFCAAHPAVTRRRPGDGTLPGRRGPGHRRAGLVLKDRSEDLMAILAPVAELCQHYRAPLMLHATDRAGAGVSGPAP